MSSKASLQWLVYRSPASNPGKEYGRNCIIKNKFGIDRRIIPSLPLPNDL